MSGGGCGLGFYTSEQRRDDSGQFPDKLSEQAILKLFDRIEESLLTTPEIGEELDITRQTANRRLKRLQEKDAVGRKDAGSNATVWWAKVAPRLAAEAVAREESDHQHEPGETVSMNEARKRLALDG